MNNAELAAQTAEQSGISKEAARKIVDAIFAAIVDTAASGGEVSINGFGKFKVKESAERDGRNPATGETIKSPHPRSSALLPQRQ